MTLVVIADDLSGASEALCSMGMLGTPIWLYGSTEEELFHLLAGDSPLAVDSNLRVLDHAGAAARTSKLHKALQNSETPRILFYKVDSLLRGHIETLLVETSKTGPVLVATANPPTSRTTVGGVIYVDGVLLSDANLWDAELTSAPKSIAAAAGSASVAHVSLEIVRGPANKLVEALSKIFLDQEIAVCDCETDQDLRLLVAASIGFAGVTYVGAASLGKAVAGHINLNIESPTQPKTYGGNVAVIVGSESDASVSQLKFLRNQTELTGVTINILDDETFGGGDLVLTGGATARAVIDALKFNWIKPLLEIEPGSVLNLLTDGRLAVIKPGSYGSQKALFNAVQYLKQLNETEVRSS